MVNSARDDDLAAIEEALIRYPGCASAQDIMLALAAPVPIRTLQYRLKIFAGRQRILRQGGVRSARYRLASVVSGNDAAASSSQPSSDDQVVPISAAAAAIRDYVCSPPETRNPVGLRSPSNQPVHTPNRY